jgi:hypothetical protein
VGGTVRNSCIQAIEMLVAAVYATVFSVAAIGLNYLLYEKGGVRILVANTWTPFSTGSMI